MCLLITNNEKPQEGRRFIHHEQDPILRQQVFLTQGIRFARLNRQTVDPRRVHFFQTEPVLGVLNLIPCATYIITPTGYAQTNVLLPLMYWGHPDDLNRDVMNQYLTAQPDPTRRFSQDSIFTLPTTVFIQRPTGRTIKQERFLQGSALIMGNFDSITSYVPHLSVIDSPYHYPQPHRAKVMTSVEQLGVILPPSKPIFETKTYLTTPSSLAELIDPCSQWVEVSQSLTAQPSYWNQ